MAAVGVDLLQSRDVDTPSLDDWGSCGQACGKSSCGILCHSVLPQVVNRGLPTWGSMLPPSNEPLDSVQVQRQRIQKKAWRAKCFLTDVPLMIRCLLLGFLAAPIERLMCHLDHLDSGSKGLYDAATTSRRNPILLARSLISQISKQGVEGPLGLICDMFPDEKKYILPTARAMACNFQSQLFWRFLSYFDFPRKFACMVHPGFSKVDQARIAFDFCALQPCCRRREFCAKVAAIIPDARALFKHAAFRRLLSLWVHAYKFTNMKCERLLANLLPNSAM